MGSDHFPWELLKANCLRLVCSQLITSTEQRSGIWFGKRDEMVSFLHSVHEHGRKSLLFLLSVSQVLPILFNA